MSYPLVRDRAAEGFPVRFDLRSARLLHPGVLRVAGDPGQRP